MNYDYIIVGAGPCGIFLSWLLSKQYKILLIEKEKSIGGCHRVIREDNLFTEHGPRVYSNAYVNFISLLKDMDLNFYDIFVEYNFSISTINRQTIKDIKYNELLKLSYYFIKFLINDEFSRTLSLEKLMNDNNFSKDTKDLLDRICRLTDGAGANRYTVYEFFNLMNQNFFYKLYQPKKPNDELLFKLIYEKLINNNVDIKLNSNINKMNYDDKTNKITSILINNIEYKSNNVVIATPISNYLKLIKDNNLENKINYKKLLLWNELNSYDTYIPVSFHWKKRLDLKKVWGFNKTKNGLAFIVLSDYMDIDGTIITTCFTKVDDNLHKLNKEELIDEAFRQLKDTYNNIDEPDKKILYSKIYRDDNKWKGSEDAYMMSYDNIYVDIKTNINNLYTLGSHNGNAEYSFTSMESACSNAIYMSNMFLDDKFNIKGLFTLKKFIKKVIIIIMIYLLYRLIYIDGRYFFFKNNN